MLSGLLLEMVVGLHLLIPLYSYLTFTICFDWFWCIIIFIIIMIKLPVGFSPYVSVRMFM
jgi:hypothetical protein